MPLRNPALEVQLPGIAARMTHQAGDLDLMHRENHSGRAAGRAQDSANVGDIGRRGALAAQLSRNRHAEQFTRPDRLESLERKARVAIDYVGVVRGDLGRCFCSHDKVARCHRRRLRRWRAAIRDWVIEGAHDPSLSAGARLAFPANSVYDVNQWSVDP